MITSTEDKIRMAIEGLAIRAIRENKYSLRTIADICALPLRRIKYLKRFSKHVTLQDLFTASPEELEEWKIIDRGMEVFQDLFNKCSPDIQKYATLLIENQIEYRKWLGILTTESELIRELGFTDGFLESYEGRFNVKYQDDSHENIVKNLISEYEKACGRVIIKKEYRL